MKLFDRVVLNVLGYCAMALLFFYIVKNLPAALFIAFLSWLLLNRILQLITARIRASKKLTVEELELLFAVMGVNEQRSFFFNAIPSFFSPEILNDGIVLSVNCEKIFLFPAYKFSACGADDLARAYRTATENGIKIIYILSKKCTRDILLFSKRFPISISFIPTKKTLEFLYKQNKLPKNVFQKNTELKETNNTFSVDNRISQKIKKYFQEVKNNFSTLLSEIFIKSKAKFFFFSSFSLSLFALFVPFKGYYIAFAVLTLLLGLVCLTRNTFEI